MKRPTVLVYARKYITWDTPKSDPRSERNCFQSDRLNPYIKTLVVFFAQINNFLFVAFPAWCGVCVPSCFFFIYLSSSGYTCFMRSHITQWTNSRKKPNYLTNPSHIHSRTLYIWCVKSLIPTQRSSSSIAEDNNNINHQHGFYSLLHDDDDVDQDQTSVNIVKEKYPGRYRTHIHNRSTRESTNTKTYASHFIIWPRARTLLPGAISFGAPIYQRIGSQQTPHLWAQTYIHKHPLAQKNRDARKTTYPYMQVLRRKGHRHMSIAARASIYS